MDSAGEGEKKKPEFSNSAVFSPPSAHLDGRFLPASRRMSESVCDPPRQRWTAALCPTPPPAV